MKLVERIVLKTRMFKEDGKERPVRYKFVVGTAYQESINSMQ